MREIKQDLLWFRTEVVHTISLTEVPLMRHDNFDARDANTRTHTILGHL